MMSLYDYVRDNIIDINSTTWEMGGITHDDGYQLLC